MTDEMTIRLATREDLAAVDTLLAASYPVLLKPHYKPSVLVTALPLISRGQPRLLSSGQFFVAMDEAGRAMACGGWSETPPLGGVGPRDLGHIRHFATHPSVLRRGVASRLMAQVLGQAMAQGMRFMHCQSTRTAVPFYTKQGFQARGEVEITLRPGIVIPAVEMARKL